MMTLRWLACTVSFVTWWALWALVLAALSTSGLWSSLTVPSVGFAIMAFSDCSRKSVLCRTRAHSSTRVLWWRRIDSLDWACCPLLKSVKHRILIVFQMHFSCHRCRVSIQFWYHALILVLASPTLKFASLVMFRACHVLSRVTWPHLSVLRIGRRMAT